MLDVELLSAPFARKNSTEIRDWIGNVWPAGSLPVLPDAATWISPQIPSPQTGDGLRAGGHEWAAFGLAAQYALETGQGTMIEAGASQGPWCLSWVRALSTRWTYRNEIRALAIEAGDGAHAAAEFWAAQGLEATIDTSSGLSATGSNWRFEWRRAAVVAGGGDVFFPKVDIRRDNGARPERSPLAVDYRGVPVEHERVAGLDLRELVGQFEHVTLLHCDLQGAEQTLLQEGSFECIAGTTDVVLLGTHSRSTEQLAFELMPTYGFTLMGDSACVMTATDGGAALAGDGEQVWVSQRAAEFYLHLVDQLSAPKDRTPLNLGEAMGYFADLEAAHADLEAAKDARARAEQLSGQLEEVLNSHSWQVTRPLRALQERRRGR